MSRRAKSIEQTLDEFISTAPRDALVRLQSEVSAALKYRKFEEQGQQISGRPMKVEVGGLPKAKDTAQLPMAAKGTE